MLIGNEFDRVGTATEKVLMLVLTLGMKNGLELHDQSCQAIMLVHWCVVLSVRRTVFECF